MQRIARIIRFLLPTFCIAVAYCIAFALISAFDRADAENADQGEPTQTRFVPARQPDADLAPDDVVRIQVAGLGCDDLTQGIRQCMTFASPDNVAVTGPIERFGRMVRSEPYVFLTSPDRILIGHPRFAEGRARVLVTLVKDRQFHFFVWVLSKQTLAPFEDCWMTDGVFPVRSYNDQDGSNRTLGDVI
ncbi:MAG: hypothetical protein R3E01_31260 [Pirellulaceae bacterium]|nr:hypothetical protein [Planctomycetales bacterium]